jgi:DNA-binding transcriptional LysR family regulator
MAGQAPDWHLYRAFLGVLREGSLSGAARALGLTQPTVGRQIATLETLLATLCALANGTCADPARA